MTSFKNRTFLKISEHCGITKDEMMMLIMARIEIPAKEKCFFYVCMSIHTLFMSLITKKNAK